MPDDVIGAGENRAYIATRDGRTMLLEVPLTSIEWPRTLCGISRATVTVAPAKCTPDLGRVHPWAHSLVVFRDGERAWEGPIRKRIDSRTGLTIIASDVLGWTERRPMLTTRDVTGVSVRDEAEWVIDTAFAGDDPYVLAHVQALGGVPSVIGDNAITNAEKYASQVLADLTASGARWTVLGRSILLWDEAYSIGSLLDLSPEDHLLDDVDVTEDGDLLATDVIARNDEGVIGRMIQDPGGDPADDFYGAVQQIVSSPAVLPVGVKRTARQTLNRSYPTPISINVPDNAALRCEAPFPIDALIPGILVPVTTTTATAREVRGTFMLTGVTVKQTAENPEQVTITLAPASEALS